ncbi:MAG: hypothetical protein AAGJ79_08445 [Verrucomicrobiota bacterium]
MEVDSVFDDAQTFHAPEVCLIVSDQRNVMEEGMRRDPDAVGADDLPVLRNVPAIRA